MELLMKMIDEFPYRELAFYWLIDYICLFGIA